MKRDVLTGLIRQMPVPRASSSSFQRVSEVAQQYLVAAAASSAPIINGTSKDDLRRLLLQVDAEVLRMYELPPRQERELLDVFAGWQRAGVPFAFERYFPKDYEPCFPLHEYLSEEYQRSTAGELLKRYQPVESVELREALARAIELFEE